MKIGRNELCPCGSKMKYKKCCNGKDANTLNLKNFNSILAVKKMIDKRIEKARIKTCLHPQKSECAGKVIKAHSIQNNKILSSIAENGHVMMFRPEINKRGLEANMNSVGRTVATTFTGFCSHHDKITFAPIEDRLYVGSSEQNFLFAYRALAFDRHKKLEQINVVRDCIKDQPQMLTESSFVKFYRGNQLAERDFQEYTRKFDEALITSKYDILETVKIRLNGFARIAISSAFYLQYDILGNPLNNVNSLDSEKLKMIMVNAFPQEDNTFIILSWLKEDVDFFAQFKKQFLNLDDNSVINVLNNLIPYYSENFAIGPKLWESFDELSKQEIQFVFNGEGKNAYYVPEDGLSKKRSYDLFKDLIGLN